MHRVESPAPLTYAPPVVFTSGIFLYAFLPLFLLSYYASPKGRRSLLIAVWSYVFYGWWRPDFVLLMLLSTVVDFSCGRGIARAQARGETGRPFLLASLLINLGLLGYFKYANFGIDSLNQLLARFDLAPIAWTGVVLPVGISFYTFQTLSYTIDLYRRRTEPVRGFSDFMCYVAMFPQLIAGPIVRYRTVAAQLREREHSWQRFSLGVLFFQTGLVKKVLLADVVATPADMAFAAAGPAAAVDAWIGAVAYAFQIYFDFSGYSDMAIGLGLMIGFRLPINFNRPYAATSITDFWRRWHISLSTFLRDYLYIPLGGNRRGPWRTYLHLMLTMLLGGLWHGAAWTFVAWGAYQGLFLAFERWLGKRPLYAGLPRAARIAITFMVVLGGWVLFRSPDLGFAGRYLLTMAGLGSGSQVLFVRPAQWLVLGIAAVAVWGFPTTQNHIHRGRTVFVWMIQALFVVALLHLHYQEHVPFLYYQF